MRKLLTLCVLAISPVALAQSTNQKQAALKLPPGAYYWNGSDWASMQQISAYGSRAKHVARMLVPGLAPQAVLIFPDAQAPIQVPDATPLFCYKYAVIPPGTPYAPYSPSGVSVVVVRSGVPYAPSGRDIVIARFDREKDHRELQLTSGATVFTMKTGPNNRNLADVAITQLDSSTFLVSPKAPLKPGEYLLSTFPQEASGFDFGVHPTAANRTSD